MLPSKKILDQFKETSDVKQIITLEKLDLMNVTITLRYVIEDEPFGQPEYREFENSDLCRKALEEYFKENEIDEIFLKAIILIWGKTPKVIHENPDSDKPEGDKKPSKRGGSKKGDKTETIDSQEEEKTEGNEGE